MNERTTWLLDGVPTEYTGASDLFDYRLAFTLSYELGGRAYEAMRLEHEAYLKARYP